MRELLINCTWSLLSCPSPTLNVACIELIIKSGYFEAQRPFNQVKGLNSCFFILAPLSLLLHCLVGDDGILFCLPFLPASVTDFSGSRINSDKSEALSLGHFSEKSIVFFYCELSNKCKFHGIGIYIIYLIPSICVASDNNGGATGKKKEKYTL